jgi:hypothetical protein
MGRLVLYGLFILGFGLSWEAGQLTDCVNGTCVS